MHKYAIFCEITSDPRPVLGGGRPYRSLARQPFGPGKSESGGAAGSRGGALTGDRARWCAGSGKQGSGILRVFAPAPAGS
ncbi:hypothetical protein CBM2617_A330016 [Cupriavidus taiwanensis]|nr:hypothetical protein CBM2617_A330016 [Cupriavidus taiwanensis]